MYRDPMSSAFEMFRMMANAAEAFNRWSNAGDTPADDSQRLARLYMAYVNSGYRYLARWADIAVKRYPDFAQTFASVSKNPNARKAELNALLDQTRRYMREMAELPVEEAKRLQEEIEEIMGTPRRPRRPRRKPARARKAKRRGGAKP